MVYEVESRLTRVIIQEDWIELSVGVPPSFTVGQVQVLWPRFSRRCSREEHNVEWELLSLRQPRTLQRHSRHILLIARRSLTDTQWFSRLIF